MKLNIVLPWVCVLGLGAGLAAAVVSNQKKNSELAQLREEGAQVGQLRTELEKLQTQTKEQADKIMELGKGNQELLRLRSEKQQLTKQLQQAQSQAQQAQAQVAQAAVSGTQQLQQLQNENQQLRTVAVQSQQSIMRTACLNHLQQMEAAKQQWALEFSKPAGTVLRAQEIAPYLKGVAMPICPSAGIYTINAVGVLPTCSIPGHSLSP